MGESNPEAVATIKQFTGHEPRYGTTSDGQQCLHIGDLKIVATQFALWSDPSVFVHDEGMLSINWGGQTIRLYLQTDSSWSAECLPDVLAEKPRWVL